MIPALIILGVTVAFGALLYVLHVVTEKRNPNSQSEESSLEQPAQSECCGLHITCERDSLSTLSTEIVYYDDEELDRFRGTAAGDYSDDEVEEFRDVLLTLLPQDIAGWARSLQLRGIELPADVRDELLMLVSEEREKLAQTTKI